jgi:hypothetical protein
MKTTYDPLQMAAPSTPARRTNLPSTSTSTPKLETVYDDKSNRFNPTPIRKLTRTVTDVNYWTLGNPDSKSGKAAKPDRGNNNNNTASEAVADAEADTEQSGVHYAYHTSIGDIATGNPNIPCEVCKKHASLRIDLNGKMRLIPNLTLWDAWELGSSKISPSTESPLDVNGYLT